MKMMMRLDKTQVGGIKKYTSSGTFRPHPFIMAGYKNYTAVLVGGAGGNSGDMIGSNSGTVVRVQYASGGGGGGNIRLQGLLTAMNASESYTVGAAGSHGANSAPAGYAGNGSNGGATTFRGHSAYGGKGATGGRMENSSGITIPSPNAKGGDGGGNSSGYGSAGVGATPLRQGFYSSNGAPYPGTYTAPVEATPGSFGFTASGEVNGGGCGGGGGGGAIPNNTPLSGARGSDPTFFSDGSPGSGYDGGCGGGANISPVTGVSEIYGQYGTGKNPGGVFAIKFT